MKYLIISLLSLLGLSTAAQTTTLKWIDTRHDFGAFDESVGKVTCQFKAVNTGSEPMVIIRATASCGCTRPEYSLDPVAPGDTAVINVAFDPEGRPGRFEKRITVYTNTEPEASRLFITGVVVGSKGTISSRFPNDMGDMSLSTYSALLGTAQKGHVKSVFIDGYNTSTHTITPVFSGLPSWLDVAWMPHEIEPGERASFNFFVQPDKTDLYGVIVDTVSVAANPGAPSFALPVIITLEEDFSRLKSADYAKAPVAKLSVADDTAAENATVGSNGTSAFSSNAASGIGSNKVSGIVTRFRDDVATVVLTNEGRSPLQIRRAYTMTPGVTVTPARTTLKPGKSTTITIRTATPTVAPATKTPSRITVSVITNDPVTPLQTITLIGS